MKLFGFLFIISLCNLGWAAPSSGGTSWILGRPALARQSPGGKIRAARKLGGRVLGGSPASEPARDPGITQIQKISDIFTKGIYNYLASKGMFGNGKYKAGITG